MLCKTKGIVLRSVKYGETSLILSVFTEVAGLQSYMVKGVRSDKVKTRRAGLLQVASLLDIVAEHKPGRQLQHIREFQPAFIYQSLQEEIVKNSIAVFSVELLSRFLPQEETMEDLFQFVYDYFLALDECALNQLGNFPVYFIIQCGRFFGYNISGNHSAETPYLNASEGGFSAVLPASSSVVTAEDMKGLEELLSIGELRDTAVVRLNAASRNRILDWYIQFLQYHTQHLSGLRSLEILRTILH